ncbi:MAG TPA: ribulose-phosphate 3-epimerase [Thermoanaerobacterales bacterium]|nr:ribulose-phosphate 3-epimerase [Thermoanaerobacterales bacterium]
MIQIAPSILSADFANLGEEVKKVEDAGADLLHIDVMDGHFVPNLTIGPPVISHLKGRTSLPFDVHLMIENPENYIDEYIKAGAQILTVHIEASVHVHRLLSYIRSKGVIPGVALNPGTPLQNLEYILDQAGMVLIMSVNPGFGGQAFIPQMKEKIKALKNMMKSMNLAIPVEVDGGINEKNAKEIAEAGADILVAGSAIYNAPDPSQVIRHMKEK